ncbi:Uncharacterised protein [uncultured archaeon]|nr:Uncharacterised protein [uncultured archaeon]
MFEDDLASERLDAYFELKGKLLEEIVLQKQKKLSFD